MRANPRTCIRPAAHTHAHIYIYTPMYTHVRTYTRTRRKFFDIKSVLQHYQTEFHHQSDSIHFYYSITVQSISILAAPSVQTISICHHLIHIYHLLLTITQLSATNSIISHSSPIYYHHFPSFRTHHIPSLSDFQSNSPSYQYVSML